MLKQKLKYSKDCQFDCYDDVWLISPLWLVSYDDVVFLVCTSESETCIELIFPTMEELGKIKEAP
jgi:hypothetical protein